MSQRELAEEFQVTSGAIAQWESGQRTIPGPVLRLMSLYERDLDGSSTDASGSFGATTNLALLGGTMMAQALLASAPPSSIRARVRDHVFNKYVATAKRARGLTMKWLQLASAMGPLLSAEQREALRGLSTTGSMMTAATAARVFFEELDATPREAFREWTATPFASASIGQVHRATLKSGEEVAVKIQHPEAAARMVADLEQLQLLERVALAFMRNQSPNIVHAEMRARFMEECDYVLEARTQAWARATFAHDPHIAVPRVIERWSGRRVLTTTFCGGESLETFAQHASQSERDVAGETLWRFYYEGVFSHRLFNADPNPGNFLFSPRVVTFLDFGRVKRISATFHEQWKRLLRAILERNRDDAKRMLVDVGYFKDTSTEDLRHTLDLFWSWSAPCLVDGRFAFTPRYLQSSWTTFASDTARTKVDIHADMVFLPHAMFGLSGLLTTLRARPRCREIILPLVYPPGSEIPPPYTNEELRRFGLDVAS